MTSRGRARGRGRGSTSTTPGPSAIATPTTPPATNTPPVRGRGRGRGQAAAPVQQLQAINLGQHQGPSQQHQGPSPQRQNISKYDDRIYRPDNVETTVGSYGTKVQLGTNYFLIKVKNDKPFYQYRVDFQPEQDSIGKRKAMVHKVEALKGSIFDGTLIYTGLKLDTVSEFDVEDREGTHIRIILKLTQEVNYLSQQGLQVINLRFKQVAEKHMGLQRIRRDYYNPSKVIKIPQHKIEIFPGYEFSVRKYSGGILIGVDIKHKIIRTDTVLQYINDIMRRNGGNMKSDIIKELVGHIIMTRYNNKTYKIDDIAFDKKASDSVNIRGKDITYVEYYKTNYNIIIRDTQQPLLLSRNSTKKDGVKIEQEIHLIPEVCHMTGLTDVMRSNFKIMQDLAVYTKQAPEARVAELVKWRQTISESPEAVSLFEGLNIELAQAHINTEGRVMEGEQMLINGGQKFPTDRKKASFDNITRKKFVITSADIQDNYVVIAPERNMKEATDFISTCAKVGPPAGIDIRSTTRIVRLSSDRAEDYIRAIKDMPANVKIVVCIVPNDRKDRYDAIKRFSCIDSPIPSQVIVAKSLQAKKLMSVTTKVVMQMNAKLGGELWSVNIPCKNVMYVGIDTYHDAGSERSVGGFVASMNGLCTRYYSKITWQSSKQEIISELDVRMTDALKNYHELNKFYPEKIIIFRDGVGDGQLEAVKQTELKCIKDAIKRLPKLPELIFVVVTKRIPQRFFLKQGTKHVNVDPGTVVDTTLTNESFFDFFLVPQAVRQGTVTPTHYNVLEFSTNLTPDHIQRIAFKLCHVYYNWTGTIRVPAPCQYAHKLAFLVGESLHRDPSAKLDNLLYYL